MPDFQKDVEQCLTALRKGGVILYPTDTVWGLGCDATNSAAVNILFGIKKRPQTKGMIVLLADQQDLEDYVMKTDSRIERFLNSSSSPTTVIYPGAKGLAGNLLHADGSVAIRIVNELFCRTLIRAFHKPIVSTSANISGEPAPENYQQISKSVLEAADYIVQYRRDDLHPRQPSSLVKYNSDGTFTLVRP